MLSFAFAEIPKEGGLARGVPIPTRVGKFTSTADNDRRQIAITYGGGKAKGKAMSNLPYPNLPDRLFGGFTASRPSDVLEGWQEVMDVSPERIAACDPDVLADGSMPAESAERIHRHMLQRMKEDPEGVRWDLTRKALPLWLRILYTSRITPIRYPRHGNPGSAGRHAAT